MISSFSLGTLCALFNATAATLMTLGFVAIKAGRRQRHRRLMLSAFASSCAFLTVYLTRIALFGDAHFARGGALRIFYLSLLASHVLLALATAPLVITTLTFGLRARYRTHKRIARITLPIWAYVSVTGVMVYAMLYGL